MNDNICLKVKRLDKEVTFTKGEVVTFEFDKLAVSFTPRFIYKLLINADPHTFRLLNKSSTEDFMSGGK